MKFPRPLIQGTFLKRYKRFFADIQLDNGVIITAHCPNSGRMTSCIEPGWKALVSFHDDPKRKLKYTLQCCHNGLSWICVNTHLANKIVKEALEKQRIPELSHYPTITSEVKTSDASRLDFMLQNTTDTCFVEVKSVTLKHTDSTAMFPDAVTTRGQKHLKELIRLKHQGHKAVLLFLIQREDVTTFLPATHVDPDYAALLNKAQNEGVDIFCYISSICNESITLKQRL